MGRQAPFLPDASPGVWRVVQGGMAPWEQSLSRVEWHKAGHKNSDVNFKWHNRLSGGKEADLGSSNIKHPLALSFHFLLSQYHFTVIMVNILVGKTSRTPAYISTDVLHHKNCKAHLFTALTKVLCCPWPQEHYFNNSMYWVLTLCQGLCQAIYNYYLFYHLQ